jgi:hypothetical protein
MNYKKIYKKVFGDIPTDEDGRSYDIHHKDGDKTNNDPSNLVALSIKEHYDIHYSQSDWAACSAIAMRMKLAPEIISELSRLTQLKRIAEGTHNFLDPKERDKQRTATSDSVKTRIKNGTFHFLGEKNPSHKRIAEGTHNFTSKFTKDLMSKGRHNLTYEYTCPHCGKEGKGPLMFRWHFNKCKKASYVKTA